MKARIITCAMVGCWLCVSGTTASATDKDRSAFNAERVVHRAAGGGPYFRLVPVHPQGADADPYPVGTIIDEEAGTISFPDGGPRRVWFEARFGGWGGFGTLSGYQWSTEDFTEIPLLQTAQEPCTPGAADDEYCRLQYGEGDPNASGCNEADNECQEGFLHVINGEYRADFLDLGIFVCAVYDQRPRCGGVLLSGDCVEDDGGEYYAGTLVVETTAEVTSPTVVPVDLLTDPFFTPDEVYDTFLILCDQSQVLPPDGIAGIGATITFRVGACESDADCNDNDACTADVCDLDINTCENTPLTCDDDNLCTIDDCHPDTGCSHEPIVCDDEDPCTTDSCNPDTGLCEHTPIPVCPPENATTAFTYSGRLESSSGSPISDTCDFRFGLWDDPDAGDLLSVGAPLENPAFSLGVDVFGGHFTTLVDFGADVFNGDPRWLEIGVRCSGDADFVDLAPRVPLTPTPYALRATHGVGPADALNVSDAGRVGIGRTKAEHPLHLASGAHVTAGGVWTNASSAALKENFADVSPAEVLARVVRLPVRMWNYRNESTAVRHIAPTAEDFHAAFGLGGDAASIGTIDADGVALAAIQGLHELLSEKTCEIQELRDRNDDLSRRNEQLEERLARIEALLSSLISEKEKR